LFSKKGGVFLFKKRTAPFKAIIHLNNHENILIYMNRSIGMGKLHFGTRKIQKIRHSYTVIIPKALADVLGLKEGNSIGFVLTRERQLVLQMEEMDSEAK
jgi:hypothetical protein